MERLQARVGIVGAGPAGLLLSQLLSLEGIDSVVLEQRSREYVEHRVRAGVVEHGAAQLLEDAGVGSRMRSEGLVHHGIELRFDRTRHRVPLSDLASGRAITVYGQQEIVKDLVAARLEAGGVVRFEADVTSLQGLESDRPSIHFLEGGEERVLECEVIAGCDGFHGVARSAVPPESMRIFDRVHPFGWLGILAGVAPSTEELIYCRHDRGFAMHSMRSPEVSRLYLQVHPDEVLEAWPDERIWEELALRFETDDGWSLSRGPILEKGITAMRSYVIEPMRFGSLFLAGDAAHIVPPTGAKGMNLALADVRHLAAGLVARFASGDDHLLDTYSATSLRRVWRAQEFSTWMTTTLHPLAGEDFDGRLAEARLRQVVSSEAAATVLAENYVDLTSS